MRLECFLESDDKEKQDFSVYTFRKAQDDNTNKIVKAILNMKNARIRRLYCHGEVRYEYLIAYFKGMAYATVDDQTSSRIWEAEEELFIECGGEVGDYITNRASVVLKKLTDEEAIDRYLQLFESWGS